MTEASLVRVATALIALAVGMILGDWWQQPTLKISLQPAVLIPEYIEPRMVDRVRPKPAPYEGRCVMRVTTWHCPEDDAWMEQ